jgi:hypothetical protein
VTSVLAAVASNQSAGQCFNIVEAQTAAMRLFYEQVISAAGASLELVRVPDETLPSDLQNTGAPGQHLLASPAKANTVLSWRDTASPQILRRAVTWHLAHPPSKPDNDFSDDDAALAAAR